MNNDTLKRTSLEGVTAYTAALDTLCNLARHSLLMFEKNFEGLGFNNEARYETLRRFLLANPANRLLVLAHDTRYLSTMCPRMMMLLRQFSARMFIHQTHATLGHITEPFAIADEMHYVRRFHYDDPRGILAQHDPENARVLKSRFMEMWSASPQEVQATKLGL